MEDKGLAIEPINGMAILQGLVADGNLLILSWNHAVSEALMVTIVLQPNATLGPSSHCHQT